MPLSKRAAIKIGASGFWKNLTAREIAIFQLEAERMCMPLTVFHAALEKALGRPVFTHELSYSWDRLKKELYGQAKPPTLLEVIDLIPAEQRILILPGDIEPKKEEEARGEDH